MTKELVERLRYFDAKCIHSSGTLIEEAADALESQSQELARLQGALKTAEAFIAGAEPRLAQDRKEAVEVVLPAIRAALSGEGDNG